MGVNVLVNMFLLTDNNPDLALEQARQAVLALRESLLPDNYDGSEEGEYVTPPHWIKEIRGASDDKS